MSSARELAWDQARSRAHKTFSTLPNEIVPLADSVGRVSAQDAFALFDLPLYKTSAMDGWVVRGDAPWEIIGEITAGVMWDGAISDSQCIRIATGAVIPEGAQAVLRWEDAVAEENNIRSRDSKEIILGQDIRPAGLECKVGDVLIKAGTRLTPVQVGLLAAAGFDEICVTKQPRIALLLLGDELVLHGIPSNGLVRDSLGIQIPALVEQLGADVVVKEYVEDELQVLIRVVRAAVAEYDMIISTGGTADGPKDHIHAAISELNGKLIVDRVKVRPGHPQLLASIKSPTGQDIPWLGLPGNPQSAVAALMSIGMPVIFSLLGATLPELESFESDQELSTQEGFNRLVAGTLNSGKFQSARYLGSAMLRGLANSTGFALLNEGETKIGELVRWLPLP
jgi:molybdopterin molybdotransferase